MQFGVFDHIDDSGLSRGEQLEQRLALIEQYDRDGFYAYHLAEHHGTPLGIVGSPNVLLAAVAGRTTRIRFGALVNVLPLYHPVRLWEEWCLLDHLSGGRLEPGIGRGASPIEASFFGVDADRSHSIFDETLEVLEKARTEAVLDHHGSHIQVNGMPVLCRPLQERLPLWFGVSHAERAPWAAERGINILGLRGADSVRQVTDLFRGRWEELGRPVAELPFCGVNRHIVVADTEAEAFRIAERAFVRYRDSFEWLWRRKDVEMPPVIGAETFAEWHRRGGAFAGTPEGARQYIEELIEATGINYMTMDVAFGGITFEEASQTASLLASEVIPTFTQRRVAS
jgi:alkanesulfonate monooxygenase SsuD/methylene tetrahydromethanopterin reductase-like flavin-dependent oxidoreductase (luciferase family)